MKHKRVLLDNELAPKILDQFEEAGLEADVVKPKAGSLEALVRHGGYSALVLQSKTRIPPNVMDAAKKCLKVIGIVGDSLNNLNVIDASNNGILVKVTEYGNTYQAANLAKRLMICMLTRSSSGGNGALVFSEVGDIIPDNCSGYELADVTVGLIGCGNVAQALALEIAPYCEHVLGYDNHPRLVYEQFHQRAPLEKPIIDYCQLSQLMERSDVISIHIAGEAKVLQQRDIQFFKRKPLVVNTSRSGAIDEEALLTALKEKRVRGVAFTLPSEQITKEDYPPELQPFLELKNVIIAPSLGKPTADAHKKNARQLAQAVIDYLSDKDLSLAVNPMDAFSGKKKKRYPVSRGARHAAIPFRISR